MANARAQTHDAESYDELKRTIVLPEACLRAVYSRPFVRHFYTDAMIEGFIKKRWSTPEG